MSDQQLLDNIHALLKEILAEFDRVCTKLEIPYAVYGGTALGTTTWMCLCGAVTMNAS